MFVKSVDQTEQL